MTKDGAYRAWRHSIPTFFLQERRLFNAGWDAREPEIEDLERELGIVTCERHELKQENERYKAVVEAAQEFRKRWDTDEHDARAAISDEGLRLMNGLRFRLAALDKTKKDAVNGS